MKKKCVVIMLILGFISTIFLQTNQNIFAGDVPLQITVEKYFSPVIKEGILFDTNIFNSFEIIKWEDPNVFKGHDGYYYMFFSGDLTYAFRKLWLFRSNTLDFLEGELIGPIIDSPTNEYETKRIRARNVLYDEEKNQYVALYETRSDIGTFGCVLTCDKNTFPYGWKEHPDNPLISTEYTSAGLAIYKRNGVWHAFNTDWRFRHYYSETLNSNWELISTKFEPYYIIRGVLMTDIGGIFINECWDGTFFFINPLYFDEINNIVTHWPKTSLQESWIHAEIPEEYKQVANPTLFYEDGIIYIYYQSFSEGDWKYCLRAKIELSMKSDIMTNEDWKQFWTWLKSQGHQYWAEYLDNMLEKWKEENIIK